MRSNEEPSVVAVSAELTAMAARLAELAGGPEVTAGDAELIDRIALLERLRSTLAAAQHTQMVAFGRSQVAAQSEQLAAGTIRPEALGRGIADQIALACHVSPTVGSRRLGVARALHTDLPVTRGLLITGAIGERLAETIVSETSHLDPEQRRLVDTKLADTGLPDLGRKKAEAAVRKQAYETDPKGYVERGRKARKDRRVTLRPAPDTMAVLSALMPAEQGVACWAALRSHTDKVVAAGDERTRDQIMNDTLAERVLGTTAAEDVDVEVGIVIPLDALTDPDNPEPAPDEPAPDEPAPDEPAPDEPAPDEPAPDTGRTGELIGYGPLPAGIVRDIIDSTRGRRWWRRLFTRPGNILAGGDPRRRRFDGFLAHLIGLRDHGMCRDPFCGAPIRHTDHIVQRRAGGPTSYSNGRGVCARGNYVREMPGWHTELVHDGLGDQPHTVRTTTPTGHAYASRAGP